MNSRAIISRLYKLLYKIGEIILRLKFINNLLRPSLYLLAKKIRGVYLPDSLVINNLKIYCGPKGSFMAADIFAGDYEGKTVELFKRLIKKGMTVVDLGANIGYYSLIGAQCAGPNGKVYAFEPNPHIFEILLKNIKVNQYDNLIIPVQMASWNKQTTLQFWIDPEDSGSSSVYEVKQHHKVEYTIQATSLDEYFAQKGWPEICIIKMDVEGAEKNSLKGAKELVARNHDLKLIMEFNPGTLNAANVTAEELCNTLIRVGFKKFSVIQEKLLPVNIPEDIPLVSRLAKDGCVNLLCEK